MRNNSPFLWKKEAQTYTRIVIEKKIHFFVAEFTAIVIWLFALLMSTFALTRGKEVISAEFIAATTGIPT